MEESPDLPTGGRRTATHPAPHQTWLRDTRTGHYQPLDVFREPRSGEE